MNIVKAVSFKLASTLMFTVMGVQVRYLGGTYPEGQVAFFRSMFALIPILIVFGWRGQLKGALRTQRPSDHLLRGVFSVVGTFCTFAALARIPIADFTAIAFVAPLITVVFAAVFLKEHVHAYRWSAVAFGFGGVILMLTPYARDHGALTTSMAIGLLFALTNAFTAGGASIQIRRLTATETTSSIVIFMTLLVLLVSLLTAPFGWLMPSTWRDVAILAGIGIAGGLGQIFFTDSYRFAPASFLAPFDYTAMLWAFMLGYWFFGEVPTAYVVVGAAVVASAGIFVILRERYLGLNRLRDMPVAAIATIADDEEDPDAPVSGTAKAS
jgi:drug/metabolite transporter (DMT)-like permease